MRTKHIFKVLALVLCIGAFALPTTAFAAGGKDTVPPSLEASLTDGKVQIEAADDNSGVEAVYIDENRVNSLTDGKASVILKDYAGKEKSVSVYAVDYAGNHSETVKFDNPYYTESKPEAQTSTKPAQTQSAGTAAQTKPSGSSGGSTNTASGNAGKASAENSGNAATGDTQEENTSSIPEGAFTPDGSASVLDEAQETADDKQFYTITTEAGNVFYLIIDGKRDSQNVYFLNGVTEADLMALAEKGDGSMSVIPAGDTCTCTEKCEAGKVRTDCPVCKNDLTGCVGKETKPSEPEQPETEQPKKDTGSIGTIIFVVLALLAVGGIGYYVKIVRPKQQAADEEFEDDGYGEGFDPDEAYGEPEYLSEDDFDDQEKELTDQDSK
ncbi:DUF4366 domain-containing protein [[Clostridium] innocuum]|nr:DUF4366 domain-containing protein [[Clostridium] innocuum]